MRASEVLQRCLVPALSAMHALRVRTLLLAVEALLAGRRLVLIDLARSWPGAVRVRAPLKRLDRMLGNPRLHADGGNPGQPETRVRVQLSGPSPKQRQNDNHARRRAPPRGFADPGFESTKKRLRNRSSALVLSSSELVGDSVLWWHDIVKSGVGECMQIEHQRSQALEDPDPILFGAILLPAMALIYQLVTEERRQRGEARLREMEVAKTSARVHIAAARSFMAKLREINTFFATFGLSEPGDGVIVGSYRVYFTFEEKARFDSMLDSLYVSLVELRRELAKMDLSPIPISDELRNDMAGRMREADLTMATALDEYIEASKHEGEKPHVSVFCSRIERVVSILDHMLLRLDAALL